MRAALFPFLAMVLAAQTPPAEEARMRADVTFLAGPALEGRGNGSPRLDEAAAFVVKRYQELGLTPQVQRFPFIARIRRVAQGATVNGAPLVWGKDVEAAGYSADASLKGLPLRFVGAAVRTTGYDDLTGLDLKGRAAVIMRKLPDTAAFLHMNRMDRSLLSRIQKLETAGAAAILIVEDEDQPRPLVREEGPVKLGTPILSVPARALVPALGDLKALAQLITDTGQPQQPKTGPATLDLTLTLAREEAQLPNVATVIQGSDPKLRGEYIILGAHMDHLGLGERHSLGGEAGRGHAHPGADDNASGTAMVLELARTLKAKPPARSILLLNFSGEEEGLLGSAYWVQHPTVPLASVKFMVNLDMVGRLDPVKPTLLLGGLGAPKAALDRAQAFAPKDLPVGGDLGAAVGGSDHMSFSAAKIPTFFFFTGIHGDYHRPGDTPGKLNYPGMVRVAAMTATVLDDLANTAQVPAFDPDTAKLPASKGEASPMRVAFGTLPDYGDNPKGFRLNGTTPGGTAEAVGLKAGDIITAFGKLPVKNIYDFMGALGAYKPGDKVVVKWLRDGAAMEAEAQLKGR